MGYHSTSACQTRCAKPTTTGRPFKPASTCAPTHELNRPKINFSKHAHASAAPRRHPRYATLLPGPNTEPNTQRGSPPPRRKGGIMPRSVCKGKHQSEFFFCPILPRIAPRPWIWHQNGKDTPRTTAASRRSAEPSIRCHDARVLRLWSLGEPAVQIVANHLIRQRWIGENRPSRVALARATLLSGLLVTSRFQVRAG